MEAEWQTMASGRTRVEQGKQLEQPRARQVEPHCHLQLATNARWRNVPRVHCLLGLVALSGLFVIQGPVLSYLEALQRQSGDESVAAAALNNLEEGPGVADGAIGFSPPPPSAQSPLPRYPPLHQFRLHHTRSRSPPRPPPDERPPARPTPPPSPAAPPQPPQPPRAPPQPPQAPPPAGPFDFWQAHPKTNCWWDGHGAEEVDTPNGTPVEGVRTLVACLHSCVNLPQYACDAALWLERDKRCYRKRHINLPKCASWRETDLYVRTDTYLPLPPAIPSPPRPPPTPPVQPPAAPPPPVQPPAAPPPLQPGHGSHDVCVSLWKDPTSRFHDLWGYEGWRVRGEENPACWGGDATTGRRYFDDAWWGRACETRNWYTGTPGSLGDDRRLGPSDKSVQPHFTTLAPALLGFDETIDDYCAQHGEVESWMGHSEACVHANVNILSLYGSQVPYNICRNLEWQLCAAKGTLPGQAGEWVADGNLRAGRKIRFAYAPGSLEPFGAFKPLGACEGYMPKGCGNQGYASSDIFYMEACIYDQVCSNRESFWQLQPGEDWQCQMDYEGFEQFRDWVLLAR